MARMLDLIREGAAPASMMRRAAQGRLSLPADEAIEILVELSAHRELGAEAEQTLEGWDEQSLIEVASNPSASPEMLIHLLRLDARRPSVVTALCENPAVPIAELEAMAGRATAELLPAMTRSARVRESRRLLELVAANPMADAVGPELPQWLLIAQQNEAEQVASLFLERHAHEVEREDGQPFELVTGAEGEDDPLDNLLTRVKRGETPAATEEIIQLSMLQKIAQMRVGDRIKLAMRGNREERMVLIRDRSKLVSVAVLESPKVTDSEMEGYAALKNVQETVLRAISNKRNYIKNYGVLRALVNNPKTPLDVALPLVAHLLLKDQHALAVNKNMNETVRKMAMKIFRMKTERKKSD
jgi:hypothetical protein